MVAIECDLDCKIVYTRIGHQYDKKHKCYRLADPIYDLWLIQEDVLLKPMGRNLIFCLEGDEEKALLKLIDLNTNTICYIEKMLKELEQAVTNKTWESSAEK